MRECKRETGIELQGFDVSRRGLTGFNMKQEGFAYDRCLDEVYSG